MGERCEVGGGGGVAGLAIKNYWAVDDNTVVFVADPSLGGNILNFNVGANVDLQVPRVSWGTGALSQSLVPPGRPPSFSARGLVKRHHAKLYVVL